MQELLYRPEQTVQGVKRVQQGPGPGPGGGGEGLEAQTGLTAPLNPESYSWCLSKTTDLRKF